MGQVAVCSTNHGEPARRAGVGQTVGQARGHHWPSHPEMQHALTWWRERGSHWGCGARHTRPACWQQSCPRSRHHAAAGGRRVAGAGSRHFGMLAGCPMQWPQRSHLGTGNTNQVTYSEQNELRHVLPRDAIRRRVHAAGAHAVGAAHAVAGVPVGRGACRAGEVKGSGKSEECSA